LTLAPAQPDPVDRYEALRARVGQGQKITSYEHALLLHQGMPGWLTFVVNRDHEPRAARGPATAVGRAGSATSPVSDPVAGRRDVVSVLASVVSHCIGVTA
jgi:hypothetical protein